MVKDGDAWAIWDRQDDGTLVLYDSDGFCPELEQTLQKPIAPDSGLYIAQFMRGEQDSAVIELDNATALPGAEHHMFTHLSVSKCHDTRTGEVTGAKAVYLRVH